MTGSFYSVVRIGHDCVARASMGGFTDYVPDSAQQMSATRIRIFCAVFMVLFTGFVFRLGYLTFSRATIENGVRQASDLLPPRIEIVDRHGEILATQIQTSTLAANARAISATGETAQIIEALAELLPGIAESRMRRLLGEGRHSYVTLMKSLTPQQVQGVREIGSPFLLLEAEESRFYPKARLAAHVVGFTDSYMKGLAGLEARIESDGILGTRLETTLDLSVQFATHDVLARAMHLYRAKAASAIVIDVRSGAILSLVSLPDFDPNRPSASPLRNQFNHATQGVYELGSIFKIFTAAMALESGRVRDNETFDISVPLKIGKYEITDTHREQHPRTISQIVAHSSNIGAARLALRLTPEEHMGFLQNLGLTAPPYFDLPSQGMPILPARWDDIERATSSYGHGIAVTPLQFLTAASAIVNGGILYEPHIVPSSASSHLRVGRQVISSDTSRRMRQIMRDVVVFGTGRKADAEGYRVIGKTGTANKSEQGGYSETRFVTSFVGAFPLERPSYAILVMFDEPQATADTQGFVLAGWNAAPVARDLIARIAPLLGVSPSRDVDRVSPIHTASYPGGVDAP